MFIRHYFPRRQPPSRAEVFAAIGRETYALQVRGAELTDISDALTNFAGVVEAQKRDGDV